MNSLRVALCAWEIGRLRSGFGTKVGGLGGVMEELPAELVKAAARQGLRLEIELLSPCFAHYDRSRLKKLALRPAARIEGTSFEFEVYEHVFMEPGAVRSLYFWDPGQLGWTGARAVYPNDPWMMMKLCAAVSQAMAGYIRQGDFQTVHLHDSHVGLVPLYLGDEYLKDVPVHLTLHNASHQGVCHILGGGYETLDRLDLPGAKLFHEYFDYFDGLNAAKACMLKVHKTGGRVTTVSGDLDGTWGYAAELRESYDSLRRRAWRQKGAPPVDIFHPNRGLDLFEKIPVAGITNGLAAKNWPQHMPELRCAHLRALQERSPAPIFSDPGVRAELLSRDHDFDADRLERKQELRRLLYREAFGHDIWGYPALFCAVGRMSEQKNFRAIAAVVERTLDFDPQSRFVVLASADDGEKGVESWFFSLARRHKGRVYFNNTFNQPLSKLILAGSDFVLIPSRFEPCGLVDYEAALLGTLPVVRAVGGLTKVRHCGYLYDWLDVGDFDGECNAFFGSIQDALRVFRQDYPGHVRRMRAAMATDASWDSSAARYVELYRYGLLARRWRRGQSIAGFMKELGEDRGLFRRFLAPGRGEFADPRDLALRQALDGGS
ncbi:MAG: glycogen/starch synthase [Elusimicrobia bacterium]|nr:glycogen/starch synthase [Elusimicrobiota bacterium]